MPLLLTLRNHPGGTSGDQADLAMDAGEAVIGRGEGVQLLLSSPMVSRRHCVVSGSGETWHLSDTSTGGTLVNGQRIKGSQALRNGDILTLGDVEIAVAIGLSGQPRPTSGQRDSWGRSATPAASSAYADATTQARASSSRAAYSRPAAPAAAPTLQGADQRTLATAEVLLTVCIEALSAMLRARSKALSDLGITSVGEGLGLLGQDKPPADILRQLLGMAPDRAGSEITKAAGLMEQHRRATLQAMQGTFHAALDHFAPESIRQRTRDDASAWKAYERAFSAHDGFTEVFAQELAKVFKPEEE